jgi:hypothetical protein
MLLDPNVERYVKEAIKPLKKEIKILKQQIKILQQAPDISSFLEGNLSIEISTETNDFMSTDGSRKTSISVKLLLNGKEISSSSYYG